MKLLGPDFLKAFSIFVFVCLVALLVLGMLKRFDPNAKDIALVVLGAVVKCLGDVLNYWFGSSRGSAEKTQIINKMQADATAPEQP